MNYFDSKQLAQIRGRKIQHADKLVPSHFRVRCRRAWIRLRVVLLLLNVYVLLTRARLALRFGWSYGQAAKRSVHVKGF